MVVLVGVCTALVYPLKQLTSVTALAVVYLLGVLVVSTLWGLWLGVAMSALSAVAFDFFHLPPVAWAISRSRRAAIGLRSAMAGYTGFIQPAAGNVGAHGITFAGIAGAWVMTFGRFVPILAALALAGSLGPRRIAPAGLGTLRTDTPTFVIFLIGFVAIFAVLTFLTVLFLAPFAQALSSQMLG
jgi:hypothetical protein